MTTPEKLAIEGRSAGGLLMGGVMNMRPDLFGAVIAGVAFDVINTLWTKRFPTVIEWEEWAILKTQSNTAGSVLIHLMTTLQLKRIECTFLLGSMTHGSVIGACEVVAKLRQNRTNDNFLFLNRHGLRSRRRFRQVWSAARRCI